MSQISLFNHITRDTVYLIRKDKEIMLFSCLSVVIILFFYILLFTLSVVLIIPGYYSPLLSLSYLIVGFSAYIVFHVISNFFFAAILASVYKRLHGGNPTFLEGLRFSVNNIGKIIRWSIIDRHFNSYIFIRKIRGDKIVHPLESHDNMTLFDPYWSFVSSLVFPILILEGKNVKDAVYQAAEMAKKSWSDQLKLGVFHTGGILAIIVLSLFLVKILFDNFQDNGQLVLIITLVTAMMLTILGVLVITFRHIYHAILYFYCITGKLPSESLHFSIDNSNK